MKKRLRLLAAVALGLPAVSMAGVDDYVRTPAVEYGEREIDFKMGMAKLRDSEGGQRESAASLGLGYGLTQRWFTEAYVKYGKNPGERTKYDAFEWENKFQLTEPNQYFADFGFFIEIEVPRERDEGYELAFGPLVQFDTGPLRWNANLVLEKVLRSREEGEHKLEKGYQLQARYSWHPNFDFGAQALGEEHNHRAGPAVFGKVKLGGREAIVYNAALLFGSADSSPHRTFRLQAEYEF